jgi:hypothetical protein
MIFHISRTTYKPGVSEEQRRACLDGARQAGEANPAVKWYVVGPSSAGSLSTARCTWSRTSTATGRT